MKNRRSVGAESYAQTKIKSITGGGGRDDTCDNGLYVQKLENRSVPKKKKKTLEEMIISNQQQGARQVRSNTNLFVSYVPTRPLPLDRQTTTATESGTTATTKHTAYISPKSLLGEKNTKRVRCDTGTNACHSLVSSVDTVYLLRPSRCAA